MNVSYFCISLAQTLLKQIIAHIFYFYFHFLISVLLFEDNKAALLYIFSVGNKSSRYLCTLITKYFTALIHHKA
jgi:hypothetical protein